MLAASVAAWPVDRGMLLDFIRRCILTISVVVFFLEGSAAAQVDLSPSTLVMGVGNSSVEAAI